MKKSSIILFLIIVMVFQSLGGIFAQGATESAPAGPVKIVYWRSLTGVAGDVQEELVAKFNASQDKVIVESQFQGAYADLIQKLLAGLAAGEVPDVVLLDSPFVTLFAKDGVLFNLDDLVKNDKTSFDIKNYIRNLYQKDTIYLYPGEFNLKHISTGKLKAELITETKKWQIYHSNTVYIDSSALNELRKGPAG